MPLILSIESATNVCSVALHQDQQLIGLQELHLEKSHSGLLAVLIKDLVKYAGCSLKDLDAIALSKGPGSYTGLRIGTATAKGLCYALEIPLLSVNTLEAMAFQVKKYTFGSQYLCPMIDARRMEVYSLIMNEHMQEISATSPVVVSEDSYQEFLEEKRVLFFGNGASKCKPILSKSKNALFLDNIFPSAREVGELASIRMSASSEDKFEDLAYFEPFYLKDFKAPAPKPKPYPAI